MPDLIPDLIPELLPVGMPYWGTTRQSPGGRCEQKAGGSVAQVQRTLGANPYGGFLNHGGTPSHHPSHWRAQWNQGLDCWSQPFLSANWNKNPRVPWNSRHWFLFPFNGYKYTKYDQRLHIFLKPGWTDSFLLPLNMSGNIQLMYCR